MAIKKGLVFLSVLVILFALMISPMTAVSVAHAADDTVTAFEKQNVYDDLKNSVIGGNPFDITDYPHSEYAKPQIIMLAEFGYSYDSERLDDFGLYVYVYNPQDLVFNTSSVRNKIQLACGKSGSAKYPLVFLNYSSAEGYEGRFYKFRVSLTTAQRSAILSAVQDDSREYRIAEFELSAENTATAYSCAQVYTYTGYALGYGPKVATESSLKCTVDGFDKYVELDVHHTVYRPQGDFYEGKQSQLNSCYFRVSEEFFTSYGDLTKIAAEWYEYITKPMLVTETNYLYQQLYKLHGSSVFNFPLNMDFLVMSLSNTDTSWFGKSTHGLGWTSSVREFDDDYWAWTGFLHLVHVTDAVDPVARFDNFAAVFYTGAGKSYKERSVTAKEIEQQLLLNSESLGAPYLQDRYSSALFTDYVNDGHVRGYNNKEINKDDLFDVWWNITTKDLWQTMFGGYDVETIYDTMPAIVTSGDKDFDLSGSDEDIAARFYISEGDVADFKSEYQKAQLFNERLVLFRFGQSDYYSIPCVEAYCASSDSADQTLVEDCAKDWTDGNYTAYMAQETVYLDFDIISLWFTAEDGTETEIPVIASPTDVFSGLEAPADENYHNEGERNILAIIIALLALVLLVVILWPVMPYVIKGVVWVIMLPFRLIKMIVQAVKDKKDSGPPNKK